MQLQEKDFKGTAVGTGAVSDLKEIMLRRISELEKTRRLLIVITAVLVVFAACIMVFGPEAREVTSTIIGIVLLVLAMGSIGASQFVIKGAGWEVSTGEKEKQSESNATPSKDEGEPEVSKPRYTSAV